MLSFLAHTVFLLLVLPFAPPLKLDVFELNKRYFYDENDEFHQRDLLYTSAILKNGILLEPFA